jgi:hypothetical protein
LGGVAGGTGVAPGIGVIGLCGAPGRAPGPPPVLRWGVGPGMGVAGRILFGMSGGVGVAPAPGVIGPLGFAGIVPGPPLGLRGEVGPGVARAGMAGAAESPAPTARRWRESSAAIARAVTGMFQAPRTTSAAKQYL